LHGMPFTVENWPGMVTTSAPCGGTVIPGGGAAPA
jgi:hypothetical protein